MAVFILSEYPIQRFKIFITTRTKLKSKACYFNKLFRCLCIYPTIYAYVFWFQETTYLFLMTSFVDCRLCPGSSSSSSSVRWVSMSRGSSILGWWYMYIATFTRCLTGNWRIDSSRRWGSRCGWIWRSCRLDSTYRNWRFIWTAWFVLCWRK